MGTGIWLWALSGRVLSVSVVLHVGTHCVARAGQGRGVELAAAVRMAQHRAWHVGL